MRWIVRIELDKQFDAAAVLCSIGGEGAGQMQMHEADRFSEDASELIFQYAYKRDSLLVLEKRGPANEALAPVTSIIRNTTTDFE